MTYTAISANTGSTAQQSYNVAKGLNMTSVVYKASSAVP